MQSDKKSPTALIIPAYVPSDTLPELLHTLLREIRPALIILVDDGSPAACTAIFERLSELPNCRILRHERNRGKGAALKTAFSWLRREYPECPGAVTADADGQHTAADIAMLLAQAATMSDVPLLGVRQFTDTHAVPWRSRFGNQLTRNIFRLVMHRAVSDTQTGLRYYPATLMDRLTAIRADGYDFEFEALIGACRFHPPFRELPIATVYQENNATSHFRPLLDSLRIYFVFLRFAGASLICSMLDYLIFSMLILFGQSIFISICCARLGSLAANFILARRWVFLVHRHGIRQLAEFLLLASGLLFTGYHCIRYLHETFAWHPIAAKLLVESLLFFASFTIQRVLIFRRQEESDK